MASQKLTFGNYIRDAREEKNMTINDLAYEMAKNKENTAEIKQFEKKIKAWENMKAYPTLEEIYQLAYIIEINPGELLALRNRGRKQFYRESDDPPTRRHDWIEINDNMSYILTALGRLTLIFGCIIGCIGLYKFVDTYFGKTGWIVEDQVMLREIQNKTDPENMINDGTVANMVHRIEKEAYEIEEGTRDYEENLGEKTNNTVNTLK